MSATGIQGTEGDVPGLGYPESEPPAPGPSPSKGWLTMIADAEKALSTYQAKADNIDKAYANLERLANTTRDREIQLFWANISVMAPSCYSRPPVPVVVPRFKSDDELKRVTSEMLERATTVMFEVQNIDGVMRLVRDDLVILARGVPWIRYDTTKGKQRVCVSHADRKDWLCDMARNWDEVDWVAKRSWLTEEAAKARFSDASKDAYKSLQYSVRKDAESASDDGVSKAGIWELWCKSKNKVVWVSEGAQVCLDEGEPHLDVEGFFPCPRPAYGTLERRGLVPVPDMLFYKDQLEEINEITDRIAALTDAVKVRGFYAAGAGDVADAIEAATKSRSNNTLLVPIANLTGLTGVALKDAIAWLPIEVIVATITAIIAVRKQLIEDVYEVTGLSDIMRGQTQASETLGAQQLKSQYGSVRIKDRQDELTRVARDITRISAEIMAENFSGETLMQMSQMTLPTDADIAAKAAPLQAQLAQLEAQAATTKQELQAAQADPEVQQMAEAAPDQAKQILAQAEQHLQQLGQQQQALQKQLQELAATITIDKVLKLLRADKLRPFILDIETDSTITPDENAAKQRATEFVTAIGGYLKNALPLVQTTPESAPMVAGTLKFIAGQFRAGRELQGEIDKFADAMKAKAEAAMNAPPAPNPDVIKAEAEVKALEAKTAAEAQGKGAQAQKDAAEAAALAGETQRLGLEAQGAAADADLKRRMEEQAAVDAAEEAAKQREIELLNARTAAADAELKRRMDEQKAFDDAEDRKQQRILKDLAAAQERAYAEEKHKQHMDKGVLDIAKTVVTTEAQAAAAKAKLDAPPKEQV